MNRIQRGLTYFKMLSIAVMVIIILVPHLAAAVEDESSSEIMPEVFSAIDENTKSAIFFSHQNMQKMEFIKQVLGSRIPKKKVVVTKEGSKEIYGSADIKIPIMEIKKINPTKYVVRIHGAAEDFPLVFNESYHEGWKAYIMKSNTHQNSQLPAGRLYETWFREHIPDNYHWTANGYANSWWIKLDEIKRPGDYIQNPDGSIDFELVLEFWPQRLFYIGSFISGTVFLCCLGYIGYDLARRKKSKPE